MGLTVRINDRTVTLPQGWHEATIHHVAAAHTSETVGDLLTALLGVDPSEHAHPTAVVLMAEAVAFLTEPAPLPPVTIPVNIQLKAWENWNDAVKALNAADPQILAAPEVVRIYTGRSNFPILDLLAHWSHIIEQMDAHLEQFSDLFNQQPDENELAAGIERIQALGWFATLYALADGKLLDYDKILQQPLINVHYTLRMEMERNEYLRKLNRYNEISAGRSANAGGE